MRGKAKRDGWNYFSLMALPVRAGGWGVVFSFPLIAAGGPSPFPLMEKDQKIKGFPKVPWAHGSARLLSARAALSALVTVVQNQGSRFNGRNQGPFQPSGPPSDSKPGWHCRKARRTYQSWCRAVPRESAPGGLYERMGMSVWSGDSVVPLYERRNHPPLLIAQINGDLSKREPLITKAANHTADWQHTRIAQTFNQHNRRNALLAVQAIDRSPVTLAENPPWLVRCEEICLGTHDPAPGAAAAFLCLLSFRCRKESETRGSEKRKSLQSAAFCSEPVQGSGHQPFYHSLQNQLT